MAEIIATVGPGKTHATLSLWEASLSNVPAGDQAVAECYGGANLGSVTISGITLGDAQSHLIIRPAVGHRHRSAYDETFAYGSTNGINGAIKVVDVNNTRVIGMQFVNTLFNDSWSTFIDVADGYNLYVEDCIFNMKGSVYTNFNTGQGWQQQRGVHGYVDRNTGIIELKNCVFMDFAIAQDGGPSMVVNMQAQAGDGSPLIKFLNCTADELDYFGQYGTRIQVKNCLASNPSGKVASMFNGFGWHSTSDYNTSEDASSPGGANDQTGATISYRDQPNGLFMLTSELLGTDLTSDGVTTDIRDRTRTNWTRGAFEYKTPVKVGIVGKANNQQSSLDFETLVESFYWKNTYNATIYDENNQANALTNEDIVVLDAESVANGTSPYDTGLQNLVDSGKPVIWIGYGDPWAWYPPVELSTNGSIGYEYQTGTHGGYLPTPLDPFGIGTSLGYVAGGNFNLGQNHPALFLQATIAGGFEPILILDTSSQPCFGILPPGGARADSGTVTDAVGYIGLRAPNTSRTQATQDLIEAMVDYFAENYVAAPAFAPLAGLVRTTEVNDIT